MCGKVTRNFVEAVNHGVSHATVARSYAGTKGFHVCPMCARCFYCEYEVTECLNQHIIVLKNLCYVVKKVQRGVTGVIFQ